MQALTDDNFYASGVACGDHVRELSAVSALGCQGVRDGLVIRPPLRTLNMLGGRAHCRSRNNRGKEEAVSTIVHKHTYQYIISESIETEISETKCRWGQS